MKYFKEVSEKISCNIFNIIAKRLLFPLVLICIIFAVIQFNQQNKVKTPSKNNYNKERWINKRDSLQKLIANNFEINKNSYFFNEKSDSININILQKKKLCILLFIPVNACGYCLEAEIGNIASLHTQLPNELFIIITQFRYKKEIRNFKIFNKIQSYEALSNWHSAINIETTKVHTPFYLVLNNALMVEEIFIPNPKMEELTIEFLNSILTKL